MPVISFDPIAQDDIINLIESQAPTTLITGAVQNVSDGEILTLAIGKSVATAEIIDGKFSVLVDTVALVNHKTIDATITARDEHDNTATATLSKSVSVQTEIATPTITLDDIAGDNRLLSKPRFLWIFKNLNPNTYKGLFLVWKEI